jgi:hypothetical protein
MIPPRKIASEPFAKIILYFSMGYGETTQGHIRIRL